ncbi:MAG: cytochrome c3 family protein [Akkermansia sp.]|nr:cytochrome c3 family protein [Akkermansia sp.]
MKNLFHKLRLLGHPLCLFCAAGVLAVVLVYRHAYSPLPVEIPQVMPFSHATHTNPAGVNMQCQSCHTGAEAGAGAGMPAASACLDCHRHILPQDPRLLPLHAAANTDSSVYTGEPLAWIRRTPLPAHVHFHHARHTTNGISCAECHPTPDSPTPHTMSSCLDCHRQHDLPANCDACHH